MAKSLGYALHQLAFVLDHQSDQVLQQEHGIGFSQYKIMMALKHKPGVQQNQIASYLNQTEASISRQIKLMQKVGLLDAKVREDNRRRRETFLTEKGQELTRAAHETLENSHAQVFGSLSYQEQKLIQKLLERMYTKACMLIPKEQ